MGLRLTKPRIAIIAVAGIVFLAIAWVLLSPLFIDQVVDEAGLGTEPIQLVSGQFRDTDAVHKGSGSATILSLPDGGHLLRLENLDVTNGPDLRVVLVTHPDPTNSADVKEQFLDLDALKGNIGNQNYPIPADVDVSEFGSVAVWCRAFGVLFSAAPLSATPNP